MMLTLPFLVSSWDILSSFPVPPKITYDAKLKEPLVVRAGKKTTIETKLSGVPDVSVAWTRDGTPIETEDNQFVEMKSDYSKVTILVTRRDQGGIYHLHIENCVGEDNADFRVVVKGIDSVCFDLLRENRKLSTLKQLPVYHL